MEHLSNGTLLIMIVLVFGSIALIAFGQHRQADNNFSEEEDTAMRPIFQKGTAASGSQRQRQKQQAQNLDPERRHLINNLDGHIDNERDYQPPIDKMSSLPPGYQHQIMANVMPLIQQAVARWISEQ